MAGRSKAKDIIQISHEADRHRDRTEIKLLREKNKGLLQELSRAQSMLDRLDDLRSAPKPKPIKPRQKTRGKREACPVLMISDVHCEERVDPATVNGRNEYNPDIARARFRRMAEAFCWLIRDQRFVIKDSIVWVGGDIITNYLHEENLESNFLGPTEALLFAQELLTQFFLTILKETDLETITVPWNFGNHGRMTRKPRISTALRNNLEWLLGNQMKARFADEPRLRFDIATGEHVYTQCYEQVIRWTHGDAVKYGGGIGGLMIPLRKAIRGWQTFQHAHLTNLGHFHQYMSLPDVTVNGSMIGYSPFSLRIKADYEPPAQAFYLLDKHRGKCQATSIWL